uniref:Uncharacterized protein n=1 Tax=Candidatus Kentrum sp. TUN TaxID=2126343 RepID=A0A451AED2_9GAMM|nr:MAG: hypothetical protein BECKTUN1418F_GA0071002_14931 [Candidatus Kentron sp. TUN]VFK72782.1 MAG: hypothetical protein BECKTUN1418E_GA0071001_14941 [Candidatus Kentron sp. TUN]
MEKYGRRLEVGTDLFCREIHLENPAQPRFENRERPATVPLCQDSCPVD